MEKIVSRKQKDYLKNSRNMHNIIKQIKKYLKYILKFKILLQFPMDCI